VVCRCNQATSLSHGLLVDGLSPCKLPVDQLGVRAIDDYTLEITLDHPMPYLPGVLKHYTAFPLPKHVIDALGDAWTKPENIVVNGPYKLAEWRTGDFLRSVNDLNPTLRDTQFADYHGHGWNFRGVFKRDREGNLLDADGGIVSPDDPERWRREGEGQFVPPGTNPGRTVHMMDIHAEKGLQCADCHFSQDSHGSGLIMGEVAAAVEIGCKDCHGSSRAYPTLRTSGPAAPPEGTDLSLLRNSDGQRRFEWIQRDNRRVLIQRSIVDPKLEWKVSLVKESIDRSSAYFNPLAARSKLMGKVGKVFPDLAASVSVTASAKR
jgi:hypothetical protein